LENIVWVAHIIKQEGKDSGHEEVLNAERRHCDEAESGTPRVFAEGMITET
jgi:hypothetical protein